MTCVPKSPRKNSAVGVSAAAISLGLALLPIAGGMTGCGGGGGGSTATPTPTPFPTATPTPVATAPLRLTINWPTRSRDVSAPTSALSAVVSLSSGNPNGGGAITLATINRNDDPNAYVQNFVSTELVRSGATVVTVQFFAEKDAKKADGTIGTVVAEASQSVTVGADGSVTTPITIGSKVASAELTAGQSVLVGEEKKELAFTAKDAAGNVVAVSRGSAQFALTTNNDSATLTGDGLVTGIHPGTVAVQVTVDGKTSGAAQVAINIASLTVAPNPTVKVGETVTLAFTGTDAKGQSLIIPADAVVTTVTDGSDLLVSPANGQIAGKAPGAAKITGTAYGATTDAASVTVNLGGIAVTPNQTFAVGETRALTITGLDINGQPIPVPIPASAVQISLVDGQNNIDLPGNGSIFGRGTIFGAPITNGTATVTVSAYGAGSAATGVAVTPGAVVATGSGLTYSELRLPASNAAVVVAGHAVTVNYVGYLASNGTIFDSSLPSVRPGRTPFTFTPGIDPVISGFYEGVVGMKVGQERRLFIPSALGYGTRGSGTAIPPNADLIFDIQVVGVQ